MQIDARLVRVAGAVADKPSRLVSDGEAVSVVAPPSRFVGRGGEKLDGALERFGIDVAGRTALDLGASTGGFTDCLLQRGAAHVVAVDVGRGQLHQRLRDDPRVTVCEGVNARHLTPEDVGGRPFDIVTADLSFISVTVVVPAMLSLTAPQTDLVVLVKPQFEAGRAAAAKGRGVIRDPAVWGDVLDRVGGALEARGAAIMGWMVSPLRGADGNVEFFVHARPAREAL